MKQSDKYKFNLAEDDDFYDISHQSDNWKRADDILGGFETPEFDDSGTVEGITGFPAFLETVKSKMKIFDFFKNFTAGMKFVLHTGQLVNNGLTTEVGKYPLDAAYGKTLTDMYSQLNDNLNSQIETNYTSYIWLGTQNSESVMMDSIKEIITGLTAGTSKDFKVFLYAGTQTTLPTDLIIFGKAYSLSDNGLYGLVECRTLGSNILMCDYANGVFGSWRT